MALTWSSGTDNAWMPHLLALITSFNHAADRVAMHTVLRELQRLTAFT